MGESREPPFYFHFQSKQAASYELLFRQASLQPFLAEHSSCSWPFHSFWVNWITLGHSILAQCNSRYPRFKHINSSDSFQLGWWILLQKSKAPEDSQLLLSGGCDFYARYCNSLDAVWHSGWWISFKTQVPKRSNSLLEWHPIEKLAVMACLQRSTYCSFTSKSLKVLLYESSLEDFGSLFLHCLVSQTYNIFM